LQSSLVNCISFGLVTLGDFMFSSIDDDEFQPDLSILVATADVLEQPPEIASGMEDDVSVYSTRSGKIFLSYDPVNQAFETSAQNAPLFPRIWPVLSDED